MSHIWKLSWAEWDGPWATLVISSREKEKERERERKEEQASRWSMAQEERKRGAGT